MSKPPPLPLLAELSHVPLPSELAAASQVSDELDPTEEAVASHFYSPRARPTNTLFSRVSDVIQQPPSGVRQLARQLVRALRDEEMLDDPERGPTPRGAWAADYARRRCTLAAAKRVAKRRIPALTWMAKYSLPQLHADVVAGVTVGVVLIPQGMAYAMLAELPPIYGLYSALLPLPIYAAMGTSKHMSIGPFALVSLLVADSVAEVVPPHDREGYIGAVMLLSLMIGLLHCLMAALNLGVIVRFISDSVLAGFTSAAAILISASQLKHLLGLPIPRGESLLGTLGYIATHVLDINPFAFCIGVGGIFLLDRFKRLNKRCCNEVQVPEQLLLLLMATLISWALGLDESAGADGMVVAADVAAAAGTAAAAGGAAAGAAATGAGAAAAGAAAAAAGAFGGAMNGTGVGELPHAASHRFFSLEVVGDVPSGLPGFVPPPFSFALIGQMLKPTLVVGLFSFILSMSIVRTFALQYEYATDSNQELYALGVSNIVGAFFLSYPIAGSLSRSAIVAQSAQARCTPMHGVVTAVLVLFVLLVLTPAFRPMPRTCLASIVFMAVKSLFDTKKPALLYRVKKSDFVSWCVAFSATLLLGVQLGIGAGVFTSMVLIVVQSTRPQHAVLGRLPKTCIYRDLRKYPEAVRIPGVAIFRFEASLHFANKDYFATKLRGAIAICEDRAAAKWEDRGARGGEPGGAAAAGAPTSTGDHQGGGNGNDAAAAGSVVTSGAAPLAAAASSPRSPAPCEGVSAVVVDFASVNDVDASALRMLQDVLKELTERRVRLLLCNCNAGVLELFERSQFADSLSRGAVFVSLSEAVKFGARMHAVRHNGAAEPKHVANGSVAVAERSKAVADGVPAVVESRAASARASARVTVQVPMPTAAADGPVSPRSPLSPGGRASFDVPSGGGTASERSDEASDAGPSLPAEADPGGSASEDLDDSEGADEADEPHEGTTNRGGRLPTEELADEEEDGWRPNS